MYFFNLALTVGVRNYQLNMLSMLRSRLKGFRTGFIGLRLQT